MADKCLSEQEPGDGVNRTDGVLFSFPAPRSSGPDAPVGFGNKQNPVLNEAARSSITQGQCTVTRKKTQRPRSRQESRGQSRVRVVRTSRKNMDAVKLKLDCKSPYLSELQFPHLNEDNILYSKCYKLTALTLIVY